MVPEENLMSDLIVYVSPEDLEQSIAAISKAALMDLTDLHIQETGFTTHPDGRGFIQFPHVGVDWRSVTTTGNTEAVYPEVFTETGMVARLVFQPADHATDITIGNYSRFSTYIVGSIDDLPFDLFTWVGDPAGSDKVERSIPIMVPVLRDTHLVRQSARGEYVNAYGYFCIYGGAKQGGISKVKAETAKLYAAIKNNPHNFTSRGMTQMLVEPPKFNTYTKDAALYEGTIPYSCVIRIA